MDVPSSEISIVGVPELEVVVKLALTLSIVYPYGIKNVHFVPVESMAVVSSEHAIIKEVVLVYGEGVPPSIAKPTLPINLLPNNHQIH